LKVIAAGVFGLSEPPTVVNELLELLAKIEAFSAVSFGMGVVL
jgi:hypothetical protein